MQCTWARPAPRSVIRAKSARCKDSPSPATAFFSQSGEPGRRSDRFCFPEVFDPIEGWHFNVMLRRVPDAFSASRQAFCLRPLNRRCDALLERGLWLKSDRLCQVIRIYDVSSEAMPWLIEYIVVK
jgi:hypothetical protein